MMLRFIPILLLLAFVSCQNPVTQPPVIDRTVRVIVQDDNLRPMPQIPVEVHNGTTPTAQPITTGVTDASGQALFVLPIPSKGGRFTFVVGSQQTGRVIRVADLLCRDTTFVVVLQGQPIPCTQNLLDTLTFSNACARSTATGLEYPDSSERRYVSTCDEPVTVAFSGGNDPGVRVSTRVFNHEGKEVSSPFQLPARGSFTVRIVYVPQAVGTFRETFTATLQGALTTSTVSLDISGNAVTCDNCACTDESITLDLGAVTVDSMSSVQTLVNANRTPCNRNDVLLRDFAQGSAFTRRSTVVPSIAPGRSQPVHVEFRPTSEGTFVDSLVYEVSFEGTATKCRFTVIVRAQGVRPACCIDPIASRNLVVDNTTIPPTYTIRLQTDLYSEVRGSICYYNCGSGGWLNVSRPAVTTANGFTIPEQRYQLQARSQGGGTGCFDVFFTATEQMVWPTGRGRGPAVTEFRAQFNVIGCEPSRVNVVATVDTLPASFSTCIFRWDQNRFNGYDFTPVETKGSFIIDVNASDPLQAMITDLAYLSGPGTALSGEVRIRSGWKFVRAGITDQADFTYDNIRQWSEFPTMKTGAFQTNQQTNLTLFSVYVIRVERGGQMYYALVRVREISDDGQKQKMCIDVLFPL